MRHGGNPEKRNQYEWYEPLKKPEKPRGGYEDTLEKMKTRIKSGFDVFERFENKSLMNSQIKSNNNLNSSSIQERNILSGSGRSSLDGSRLGNDPYFPHRYVEPKAG